MKKETLNYLLNVARNGHRIELVQPEKNKRLWPGLGNRAGLHSYADTLLREKYDKGEARLLKKLEALDRGARVNLVVFENITRDRGRWVLRKSLSV